MLKILNLDMLKRPMVQQLVASVRLMTYGHLCFVLLFVLHVSGSSESSWSREDEAPVAADIVGIWRCCCVALCGFRGNSLRRVRVLEIKFKM